MTYTSNKREIRWWQVWRYGELKAQNERSLAQLRRHGFTDADAQLFISLCKSGQPTPDWLMERMFGAADAARAAGEEQEQ